MRWGMYACEPEEAAIANIDTILDKIGHHIARRLMMRKSGYEPYAAARPEFLAMTLRCCDVLLVEGAPSKISSAIKYLTQSTWSHAALYVGEGLGLTNDEGEALVLIEAELGEGVIASPLSKYSSYNTRICRPVGLTAADQADIIEHVTASLGHAYDLRNIIDLMRYFLPNPPVPTRFRRKMIAFGSGDPSRSICSSLIARAFERVRYPILPTVERREADPGVFKEVLHIRHHSLFTPRDFDVSPYFQVVKPTLEAGLDYRTVAWADRMPPADMPVADTTG